MRVTPASELSLDKLRRRTSVRVMLHVGVALGGVLFARLLGTITQILIARLMGLDGSGVYVALYTVLGPMVMLASLGLDTWLLRRSGDTATLDRSISQVFSIRLVVTPLLLAGGVLAMLLAQRPDLTLPLLLVAAAGLTFELLLTTTQTALRAQTRNLAASLVQICGAGLITLFIVIGWSVGNSVMAVSAYRMLAGIVALVLGIYLLRKALKLVWRPGEILPMLKEARLFFVGDLFANVGLKADLTIIALLIGPLAAGIYNPALTIINTTFLVPNVVWQVLLPVIVRERDRPSNVRRAVVAATAGGIVYGLFWVVALLWGAEWMVGVIFGPEFVDAAPLLQIMCCIPLLKSINFTSAMLMVAYDAQGLRTKLLALASSFNLGVNLFVIPFFGLVGAAWVNLATEILLLCCYAYGAWRTVRGSRGDKVTR
jgi:O-antigen/teichoic acid export membrane protein